jgi:photosystem II stability/assembly factor-like uncharacterized protein
MGKSIAWLGLSLVIALASLPFEPLARASQATNEALRNDLFGAYMTESGRCFVVGSNAILLSSTDNGRTWKHRSLGKSYEAYDLYSVGFDPTGKTGWAVGQHGTIFQTNDGGDTWQKRQSPANDATLLKVSVLDAQTACMAGSDGTLLCTHDGGSHWTLKQFQGFIFFDITLTERNGAWAAGEYKTLLYSPDNGEHWQVKSGGKNTFDAPPYFSVAFGPHGDGVLTVLGPVIEQSNTGGQSWTPLVLKLSDELYAAFSDESQKDNQFWFVGAEGSIWSLVNGQISRIQTGTLRDLTSVFVRGSQGLAVGLGGTMLRLYADGNNWKVAGIQ